MLTMMPRARRGALRRLPATMIALCVVMVLVSCRADSLSESEQQEVHDIVMSGLQMELDEYVRAETLRAIDLAGDPDMAAEAIAHTDDRSPMVQIAALRTLLRSETLDQPHRTALHAYNQAHAEDQRLQILEIVLRDGDQTTRRAVLDRARDADSQQLRLRALEGGLLGEIEDARQEERRDDLEREFIPQLDDYLDEDSPRIAATALRALLDSGRTNRADPFLETFGDDSLDADERLEAGRILMLARVDEARDLFAAVLADADDPDQPGIPDQPVDGRLVRISVLGMTILGDTDYVDAARRQIGDADVDETLDIIDALAHNPSEEAAISLRSDIRGVHSTIRRHAIPRYAQRDDAEADVLISTLGNDDFETRRLSLSYLSERFSDEWIEDLQRNLSTSNPDRVERTLRILQQLLRAGEKLETVAEVSDHLEELAAGERFDGDVDGDDEDTEQLEQAETIRNLSAYVLFRVSGDEGSFQEIMTDNPEPQTRAAYLEYLATHQPREHADILRDHLYDDLYVMRLFAATGLWNAFSDTAQWPSAAEAEESDAEESEH